MRNWKLPALALAATLVVAACGDMPTSMDTPPADLAPALQMTVGMDAHFAELARRVPGFGGAFHDESGRLVVHMAGRALASEADQIRDEVRTHLRLRGPMARTSGSGLTSVTASANSMSGSSSAAAGSRMVLQEAAFDYGQLVDFRDRAGSVFRLPGAVYTDIDETSNRVRIGIESGANEAEFRRALEARGIPTEAITFAEAEPIVALKGESLQDRVHPLGGGLQLVFPHPDPGFVSLCTLGFNVDGNGPGRSDNYFVTNSHCTLDQGAEDGTPYYQQPIAVPDESNLIGHEVLDPAYESCFDGLYVCRYSDAALVKYERRRTPVKHDAIYRPESVNTGSLQISGQGPGYFTIVDEAPFPELGDVLNKVGRTTGWTQGEVIGTCLNVLQSGSNRVLLCQDYVGADVAGGDSGSPVFMHHEGTGDATLSGVLWGGGTGLFVFSAMENIRAELGPFSLY